MPASNTPATILTCCACLGFVHIALQHHRLAGILNATVQVLNSYGKVFPTQPPSGRPVREAPTRGAPWERQVDEADVENPAERLERKRSIGM